MTGSRTPPPGDARPAGRCVAPADLTAFAAGAVDDATRATIARHVLACAPCRARRDAEVALLRRLEAFADLGPWEEDLAAADVERAGRARARRRGALVGAAAAALLAAAVGALPGPTPDAPPRDAIPSPAARAATAPAGLAAEVRALLPAQASDGRWRAATGDDQHDVGATGLALLALVRAGPRSLEAGAVARAVADGVRWLSPRAGDPRHATPRDRAVAAAALDAVYALTRDRAVAAAAERARRSVDGREATTGIPDPTEALAYVRLGPREVAAAR